MLAGGPSLLRGLGMPLRPSGGGALPLLTRHPSGSGRALTTLSLLRSLLSCRSCGPTIWGLTPLLALRVPSYAVILVPPTLSAGRVCSYGVVSALPAHLGPESTSVQCGANGFDATVLSRAGLGSRVTLASLRLLRYALAGCDLLDTGPLTLRLLLPSARLDAARMEARGGTHPPSRGAAP